MKLCNVHCCLLNDFYSYEQKFESHSVWVILSNKYLEKKTSFWAMNENYRMVTNDSAAVSDSFLQGIIRKKLCTWGFSGKLPSWILFREYSCANDIQAWLVLHSYIGFRLKCCQELCVCVHQIYMLLLTCYWAPLWVSHFLMCTF